MLSLAWPLLLNQPVPGTSVLAHHLLPALGHLGRGGVHPLDWIFNREYGLLNSALQLIGIRARAGSTRRHWALPSFIIMSLWGWAAACSSTWPACRAFPRHLYEAAEIDGAGRWQRFLHDHPAHALAHDLLQPGHGHHRLLPGLHGLFVMTKGGPDNATLTWCSTSTASFEQFKFGYASALAWVLFVIILLFTLLRFRSSAAWVYYEGQLRR